MPERHCGDCQLCCKLLPMKDDGVNVHDAKRAMIEAKLMTIAEAINVTASFPKPAGERCRYQRHHRGCLIYDRRPFACRFWNCRWLVNDDTHDQLRPDRSHVVIDIMPDYVTLDATDNRCRLGVIQIWIDPKHPDAHKAPAIRAYIARRAAEGMAALIRTNAHKAFLLVAPPLAPDAQWHELRSQECEAEHNLIDIMGATDVLRRESV